MSFHTTIDRTTATPLIPARAPTGAPWLSAWFIVLAAIVLRFGQFGNAIAGLDEQFYLLVGDRMWAGELPYVDIWDRKPAGLFLLFAAIRGLPGDGVLAAQLVATGFAAATGILVAHLARRWTGWLPATFAGIFYIAGAGELWAGTTQTPIFFNALVAGAALLTWRAQADPRAPPGHAEAAMLLCGLAIQIKTNALFPGIYFATWLLWRTWRQTRDPAAIARAALRYALAGAAPTLAIVGWYGAIGHFDAWWQANVLSVLAKGRPTDAAAIDNLWETIILTAPIVALALVGLRTRTARFTRIDAATAFVVGWVVVGIVDFAAIGGFFPHYAIPLLLATTPLIAVAFAGAYGRLLFALAMLWPVAHAMWLNPRVSAREAAYARQVVAALPADVATRCLFIYEGPVAYYQLAHACRVTRFAFTAHLSSRREAAALGVDAAAELDATMARRPGTVLTVAGSRWRDRHPAMERRLAAILARDYRRVALLPYRLNPDDGKLAMWRRK